MDLVLASGKFTPAEVRKINYCRLYLKATTVSDLVNIKGDRLDLIKLQGEFSLISSKTTNTFIIQERPSQNEWFLWAQEANQLWSDADGRLYTPLGPWMKDVHHMSQEHFAYATETTLWVRQGFNFAKSYRLADDEYQESSTDTRQDIPSYAVPVDVTFIPPS